LVAPVPAPTLATACGEVVEDGLGTVVLGLFWASELDEPPPQPQLLMLIHDGVDQPPTLPPDRQPLAAKTDKPNPRAPTIVHREIAKRMAGDPSLVPAG
jgi:hypothetical protein